MKTTQYTIRNIPEPVDRYLRKLAKVSGQSLNAVIVAELSDKAGLASADLKDSLSWFIGSDTIGCDTLEALAKDEADQKNMTKKQWQNDVIDWY